MIFREVKSTEFNGTVNPYVPTNPRLMTVRTRLALGPSVNSISSPESSNKEHSDIEFRVGTFAKPPVISEIRVTSVFKLESSEKRLRGGKEMNPSSFSVDPSRTGMSLGFDDLLLYVKEVFSISSGKICL
jgi:hypothetical protein